MEGLFEELNKIWKMALKVIKWIFYIIIAFILFVLLAFYNASSSEQKKEEEKKQPIESTMDKRFVNYAKTTDGKKSIKLDVVRGCLYYNEAGEFEPLIKESTLERTVYDCDMKYVEEYNSKNK